jgi:hypothetical protein
MNTRYTTLASLAAIVQEKLHPTQYACTPREMILHSHFDWELILEDLQALAKEGMVMISPSETIQFFITQVGLDKISTVEQPLSIGTGFVLREERMEG